MSGDEQLTAYPLGSALAFLGRLWRLNHALERLSARMDRSLGVTAQQRFIIRCVGKYPGITAGALARVLHLDPGTVTAALHRLEAKGHVERRRDDRDRRRVTLGLTRAGIDLDRATSGTVEHAVETLLRTSSPGNVGITGDLLGTLTRLLDAEGQPKEAGSGGQVRRASPVAMRARAATKAP